MRDLNENTITTEVLQRVSGARDRRVRQISEALVRHLHAFISEVKPTEAEWQAGIAFLTETGRMCSATRQEFILLSHTLGVSMLVDAINHRVSGAATESTIFGPFYVEAPRFENGADIKGHLPGKPLYVEGVVKTPDGRTIRGAQVDIWHADDTGFYDLQKLDEARGLAGRGSFRTDPEGRFYLWTIRPSGYRIPNDGPVGKMLYAQARHPFRPEHIHFMIQAPGYRKLVTHVFAEGDEHLDSDVVFGVKSSLIRRYDKRNGGTAADGRSMSGEWFQLNYDFVLTPAAAQRGDRQ
jgi:hydroxyquinol 1,2-dioxygenase